jgi:3-hydroxyisobutyrate dehydrogenase-like beta-hydroxyacid dehydrogenase
MTGTRATRTALAKAFLANDCRVTVWNRTVKKCKPLEDAAATVASSVVASAADAKT